jgi:N-formylglutamate amidohydrolase
MRSAAWDIEIGDGPLVAAAIHNGHELRDEVAAALLLDESSRLREEDPYTAAWTQVAPTRIVARRSRFEFDLNRPRESAVYRKPEDAWGLAVWKQPPPDDLVSRSLALYDGFYTETEAVLAAKQKRHGKCVVFDLHSYNHRRDGPDGRPADEAANPEVNIGTGTMSRERWAPLIERFIADLRAFDFEGRHLDVRENVKFRGGNLGRWTHGRFPESACVLSIEFKKFFMDEWTGAVDDKRHLAITSALRSTIAGVSDELEKLGAKI